METTASSRIPKPWFPPLTTVAEDWDETPDTNESFEHFFKALHGNIKNGKLDSYDWVGNLDLTNMGIAGCTVEWAKSKISGVVVLSNKYWAET